MIEINSALVILMAEIMLVMLVLAVGYIMFTRSKAARDIAEIEEFVSQMDVDQEMKSQRLTGILHQDCKLAAQVVNAAIREMNVAERGIMQNIIRMYLQREPELLREIEQQLSQLSDPLCKLLLNFSAEEPNTTAEGPDKTAEEEHGLVRVNQQLIHQLETAMHTIDEITGEYTRVFSGHQSALELENSLNKMLQIFHDAGMRIHHQEAQKDN